jgi:hypothetical protein
MSTDEPRPKRSDQLPEDGPESVVPDDVPAGDPESAEQEVKESGSGAQAP